jgi:hypothetical protein
MKAGLQRWAAKLAAGTLKDVRCPGCGAAWNPFPSGPPDRLDAIATCPGCGCSRTLEQLAQGRASPDPTPLEAVSRPADARVEVIPAPDGGRVYRIPASGRWGVLFVFAIFWNAIAWTAALAAIPALVSGREHWPVAMVAIFPAVGILLLWLSLAQRFGSAMLYVGPARVRLQKKLFRDGRPRDLATDAVESVTLVVFYTQNYQPVHGIEIGGGGRKLRFGSALGLEEKRWLCWSIRESLARWNPKLAVPIAVT